MVSRAEQKMAQKNGPSTQKKARVTSSRQSRKARCSSFSILLMAFLLMAFSQPTVTEGCQRLLGGIPTLPSCQPGLPAEPASTPCPASHDQALPGEPSATSNQQADCALCPGVCLVTSPARAGGFHPLSGAAKGEFQSGCPPAPGTRSPPWRHW